MLKAETLKRLKTDRLRGLVLGLSTLYVFSLFFVMVRSAPAPAARPFTVTGFQATSPSSTVTSLYRGDTERSGAYDIESLPTAAAILWTTDDLFADIHPASKSTPAVDASGIYFGSDLGVFYFYTHDGQKRWSFKVDGGTQGIHGTALLDENHVYFGSYAGNFYCLDKKTGALIWTSTIAHAVGSSPMMIGDLIVVAAEFSKPREGYLVAMDKTTGRVKWTSAHFGEQVHSSPTLSPSHGLLGVGSNANLFFGIDPFSGETLWDVRTFGPVKGTAAVYKDRFLFTSWDKHFYVVSDRGESIAKIDIDGSSQSSPAVDARRGFAYVSSAAGTLYKMDLNKNAVAQTAALADGIHLGKMSMPSPVLLNHKNQSWVATSCFGDSLCLFESEHLKLRQRLPVGGPISGSIAVWKSALYVTVNGKGLVRIDLNKASVGAKALSPR